MTAGTLWWFADQEPKEEARFFARERQVAQFGEDQELGVRELLEAALQTILVAGTHQTPHEGFEREEEDRVAGLHRLDAQGDGDVCLAHPGRAEQDDVLVALDEAQTGELADLLAIDRRLVVKVKLIEGLDPGQAGLLEAPLHAALVAPAPFGFERPGEEGLVVGVADGGLFAHAIGECRHRKCSKKTQQEQSPNEP